MQKSKVKSLVVGYGSIGQRHARLLEEEGCEVAVVSRRQISHSRVYSTLRQALEEWRPDYVVVADRTSEHHGTIATLTDAGFTGKVLIEKPLFDCWRAFPDHRFSHAAVAYNLRFHPLISRLHDFLAAQPQLIAAQIYVGQHLPQWRPTTDYRESYSARRHEGGGVLRDLSHELDFVLWLFGSWTRLTAIGGHFSPLEIDSDDVFSLMLSTPRCPSVSVHMNYLDRIPRREILVHTDAHTIKVDLINGMIEIDGEKETIGPVERDFTYRAEHQALLAGDMSVSCSLADGMELMATIDAAERAAESHKWIMR